MPRTKRTVRVMPMSAWQQLPPPADRCQVCAGDHTPEQPHNPDSLFWQTARTIAGESMPTWEEALAHVSDEVHEAWRKGLAEHDVTVAPRKAN